MEERTTSEVKVRFSEATLQPASRVTYYPSFIFGGQFLYICFLLYVHVSNTSCFVDTYIFDIYSLSVYSRLICF